FPAMGAYAQTCRLSLARGRTYSRRMHRNPEALDQEQDPALDLELDEALEMTFPASDPVAMAAPGSTSRGSDASPEQGGSTARRGKPPAKPSRARPGRRER